MARADHRTHVEIGPYDELFRIDDEFGELLGLKDKLLNIQQLKQEFAYYLNKNQCFDYEKREVLITQEHCRPLFKIFYRRRLFMRHDAINCFAYLMKQFTTKVSQFNDPDEEER